MQRLTIGQNHPLHIRHEHLATHADPCRILYISDIHLRAARSSALSRQILVAARSCKLDLLLLGGDLVDHPEELGALRNLVQRLARIAPVFAVGGNHDQHVGMQRVQDAVSAAGGRWIHQDVAHVSHRSRTIGVAGPHAPAFPRGDVQILCAHNPRIWKRTRHLGYHLVLAGHLHGCQCVAFEYRSHLFPGAFFYPHCCLRTRHTSTRLVVSRGVSDLVPLRWQCPREVVLCHV